MYVECVSSMTNVPCVRAWIGAHRKSFWNSQGSNVSLLKDGESMCKACNNIIALTVNSTNSKIIQQTKIRLT